MTPRTKMVDPDDANDRLLREAGELVVDGRLVVYSDKPVIETAGETPEKEDGSDG